MPNYYENLNLQSTASMEQIQVALDEQYNHWRMLVTHHDLQTAQQANQALLVLEHMRGVLTDPNKRSAYDAGLGISGAIGGIADPEAVLRMPQRTPAPSPGFGLTPPPPKPVIPPVAISAMQRVDAWICPRCQTANAVATHFCSSCGKALSKNCPSCDQIVEDASEFCAHCGANIKDALHMKEMERERLENVSQLQAEQNAVLGPMSHQANSAWSLTKWGCILSFIPYVAIVSSLMWVVALIQAGKILRSAQIPGDSEYRSKAKKVLGWAGIPLILVVVSVIISICFVLITPLLESIN